MREIKFRAWKKSANRMLDWAELCAMPRLCNVLNGEYLEAVMQYTGLHDKKRTEEYPDGQEIYEGDIVTEDEQLWKIVWDVNKLAGFEAQNEDDENYYLGGAGWERCEVIGNIYENPELLEANAE